jgi:hypothetical protein
MYGFKTLVSETFVGLYSLLAAKLAFQPKPPVSTYLLIGGGGETALFLKNLLIKMQ